MKLLNLTILLVATMFINLTAKAETIGNGNGGFAVNALKEANPLLPDQEILMLAFQQAKGRIPSLTPFKGKKGHFFVATSGPNYPDNFIYGSGNFSGPVYSLAKIEGNKYLGPLLGMSNEASTLDVENYKIPYGNIKYLNGNILTKIKLATYEPEANAEVKDGSMVIREEGRLCYQHGLMYINGALQCQSYFYKDAYYRQISEREIIKIQWYKDYSYLIVYYWVE